MSQRGDLIQLEIQLRNEAGVLADPSKVTLEIKDPTGTVTSHEFTALTHKSTGVYVFDLLLAEAGVYAYRWASKGNPELAEEGREVAEPGIFDEEGLPTWAPTTEQVASVIRARVQKRGGKEGTDWDDTTRPTKQQVEDLIGLAVTKVAGETVWNPCTFRLRSESQRAAVEYAAMLVEQSYWPEQTTAAGSGFASLYKLWMDGLPGLKARITKDCPEPSPPGDGGEGEEEAGYTLAQGGFDDGIALYGRDFPAADGW